MYRKLTLPLLAAACAACGDSASRYAGLDGDAGPGGAYTYDFAERHRHAERLVEDEELHLGALSGRRFLGRGWSHQDDGDEELGRHGSPLWSHSQAAELRLHLREPAERELSFRIFPVQSPQRDLQRVTVRMGGRVLAERSLPEGMHPWTLRLPAAAQREGENRLLFTFSNQRRPGAAGGDSRGLTASLNTVRLRIVEDRPRRRFEAARVLCPEGSRVVPRPDGRGGVIEQTSHGSLRYYVEVPEAAYFTCQLYCAEAPEAVRFRLTAQPDGGTRAVLLDELVRSGEEARPVEVALDALAGERVRLEFRVDAAGEEVHPAEGVLGAWVGPVLHAPRPPPGSAPGAPDPGGAAAPELAGALAGAPVVLILLDACRRDVLGCYGGRPEVSPHLDRIAGEGLAFERAFSSASYTLASVGSILTSRLTWQHGVWSRKNKLVTGATTWPQAFRDHGYRTVGVTHTPNGSSMSGYDRGFELYEELLQESDGEGKRRRPTLAERVLPFLDRALKVDDGRPLFLWMHLIEPHEPYLPPHPWREKYDPDYEGEVHSDAATMRALRGASLFPEDRDVEHLWREYEANLSYVDDVLARVRERLEAAGLFDRAIVAVFSDHGEAFMEHVHRGLPYLGHGKTVYEDVVGIPLLLRLPSELSRELGLAGRRPAGLVSALDLLPTVAELAGVPAPESAVRGRSFAPLISDGDGDAAGRPFALYHTASCLQNRFHPALGIQAGPHKLVVSPGELLELYDLEADPGETTNLAPERPVLAGFLRQRVYEETGYDTFLGSWVIEVGDLAEVDEETLEQLEALGYAR